MSYHHLTRDQRSQIELLKSMGCSQKQIAQWVNRHPSTICREFKRNIGRGKYRCKQAHRFAVKRRVEARSIPTKITPEVQAFIEEKLTKAQWSAPGSVPFFL